MEVPAPAAGVLREILLHTDADAVPGAILGRIAPVATSRRGRRSRGPPAKPDPAFGRARSAARRLRRAQSDAARNPALALGQARRPPARHRPAPRSRGRAAAAGSPAPTSTARSRRRRRRPPVEGSVPAARRRHPLALRPARPDAAARSPRTCCARSPEAPHVTAVFEADFSAIIAHREAHKAAFAKKGVKLTYTAYLVAAGGRGDEGRAGDQQPLARRPARAVTTTSISASAPRSATRA